MALLSSFLEKPLISHEYANVGSCHSFQSTQCTATHEYAARSDAILRGLGDSTQSCKTRRLNAVQSYDDANRRCNVETGNDRQDNYKAYVSYCPAPSLTQATPSIVSLHILLYCQQSHWPEPFPSFLPHSPPTIDIRQPIT